MENASKALIIAGAILISIVLVSVGVLVVQQLNPDDALASMSAQEVQAFNSKFESNVGNNKTGTVVKSLLSTIATHNAQTDDSAKRISVYNGDTNSSDCKYDRETSDPDSAATTLSEYRAGISTSRRYNVKSKEGSTGQIIAIYIEQK